MYKDVTSLYRQLPAIDYLLNKASVLSLIKGYGRTQVTKILRDMQQHAHAREQIKQQQCLPVWQSDWTKVNMVSGENVFYWTLTASHRTTGWEYFITKQDWDLNAPLSRTAFELKPFCSRFDGGAVPAREVTMKCNVPFIVLVIK